MCFSIMNLNEALTHSICLQPADFKQWNGVQGLDVYVSIIVYKGRSWLYAPLSESRNPELMTDTVT